MIGESYIYGEHGVRMGAKGIEAEQVIMSCRCYAYQSCEHEGWQGSEAKAFVEALERAAVSAILDREDRWAWGAPKGWEENTRAQKTA